MCETLCCNNLVTYMYFFHLVFLGLQAIESIKVENVSELHFMQLTNRFLVTVCLFSNRSQKTSQKTSKCGQNKNMAHERLG